MEQIARRVADPLFETVREIGGIRPGGQCDDAYFESLGCCELHPAQRRRLAGSIAIEAEDDSLRQSPQLA